MKFPFSELNCFFENESENTKEFIAFFDEHTQYWKKRVFLQLVSELKNQMELTEIYLNQINRMKNDV